jgi:hypothetical protein
MTDKAELVLDDECQKVKEYLKKELTKGDTW